MNCKIAVAHGPMCAPNHLSPTIHSKRAIRHDLTKLWLAQTLRDMRINRLTRAEMTEITETAFKNWCDKSATLDNNERCSKDE
jgi:hypothetical protein